MGAVMVDIRGLFRTQPGDLQAVQVLQNQINQRRDRERKRQQKEKNSQFFQALAMESEKGLVDPNRTFQLAREYNLPEPEAMKYAAGMNNQYKSRMTSLVIKDFDKAIQNGEFQAAPNKHKFFDEMYDRHGVSEQLRGELQPVVQSYFERAKKFKDQFAPKAMKLYDAEAKKYITVPEDKGMELRGQSPERFKTPEQVWKGPKPPKERKLPTSYQEYELAKPGISYNEWLNKRKGGKEKPNKQLEFVRKQAMSQLNKALSAKRGVGAYYRDKNKEAVAKEHMERYEKLVKQYKKLGGDPKDLSQAEDVKKVYKYKAKNQKTGQTIVSEDGQSWFDEKTGRAIQ